MNWTIKFTEEADEQLLKLDKPIRERIRKYANDLEKLANPRMRGEPLKGNLSEFWKYKIGHYRLICRIEDEKLLILTVKIGHRKDVYKQK